MYWPGSAFRKRFPSVIAIRPSLELVFPDERRRGVMSEGNDLVTDRRVVGEVKRHLLDGVGDAAHPAGVDVG